MFAVSENICIFVLPRIHKSVRLINAHTDYRNKAGLSCSTSSGDRRCGFLAELTEGLALFFINKTFDLQMPRIVKSSSAMNNSSSTAQSIHRFRIRITSHLEFINGAERTYTLDKEVEAVSEYEATGRVLKELSKLMPAGNVPLSSMFGAKSCVQLD